MKQFGTPFNARTLMLATMAGILVCAGHGVYASEGEKKEKVQESNMDMLDLSTGKTNADRSYRETMMKFMGQEALKIRNQVGLKSYNDPETNKEIISFASLLKGKDSSYKFLVYNKNKNSDFNDFFLTLHTPENDSHETIGIFDFVGKERTNKIAYNPSVQDNIMAMRTAVHTAGKTLLEKNKFFLGCKIPNNQDGDQTLQNYTVYEKETKYTGPLDTEQEFKQKVTQLFGDFDSMQKNEQKEPSLIVVGGCSIQ